MLKGRGAESNARRGKAVGIAAVEGFVLDDTAIVLASKRLTIDQIQSLYFALQAYGLRDIRLLAFDSG